MSCMRLSQTPDKAFVPYVSRILFWRVLDHYQVLKCVDFFFSCQQKLNKQHSISVSNYCCRTGALHHVLASAGFPLHSSGTYYKKNYFLRTSLFRQVDPGASLWGEVGGALRPLNNMADLKVGNTELEKYELEKFFRVKCATFKLETSRN